MTSFKSGKEDTEQTNDTKNEDFEGDDENNSTKIESQ